MRLLAATLAILLSTSCANAQSLRVLTGGDLSQIAAAGPAVAFSVGSGNVFRAWKAGVLNVSVTGAKPGERLVVSGLGKGLTWRSTSETAGEVRWSAVAAGPYQFKMDVLGVGDEEIASEVGQFVVSPALTVSISANNKIATGSDFGITPVVTGAISDLIWAPVPGRIPALPSYSSLNSNTGEIVGWTDLDSYSSNLLIQVTDTADNTVAFSNPFEIFVQSAQKECSWRTLNTTPVRMGGTAIHYAAGGFVTVGSERDKLVAYSGDQSYWFTGTSSGSFLNVTHGGGTWIAVGEDGEIRRSTNGYSWVSQKIDLAKGGRWTDVVFNNGRFVVVGQDQSAWAVTAWSDDGGVTWKAERGVQYGQTKAVAYGHAGYIGVGASFASVTYSEDGKTWGSRGSIPVSLSGVAYGNGVYVATAGSGRNNIYVSSDGVMWTPVSAPAGAWSWIDYIDGTFIAGGARGLVMNSTDGINWSLLKVPDDITFTDVTFAAGEVFLVGYNRIVATQKSSCF